MAQGRRGPFSFRTDLDTDYLLEIDVERRIEFEQLNCMLGIETLFPERCRGLPSLIDISWRVLSNSKTIGEGNANHFKGGGWEPTIQREIGSFRASKGHSYSLDLVVNRDAGSLNIANPKITVAAHPSEYKGNIILAQLIGMGATLVALAGLAFGAYAAGRALLHR